MLHLLLIANIVPNSLILFTLKMEATYSSETSILTRGTRHHIPDDYSLHYSCTLHQRTPKRTPYHPSILHNITAKNLAVFTPTAVDSPKTSFKDFTGFRILLQTRLSLNWFRIVHIALVRAVGTEPGVGNNRNILPSTTLQ
jgi:hypothetical protein